MRGKVEDKINNVVITVEGQGPEGVRPLYCCYLGLGS